METRLTGLTKTVTLRGMKSARLHSSGRSVRFADGGALSWLSCLPIWPGGTKYEGQTFDFASRLSEIEACLTEQIRGGAFQPAVIDDHNPSQSLARGVARDFRILTAEQAGALGIPQKAPHEVYLGVDWSDPAYAAAYDAGSVLYTSPQIRGSVLGDVYAYADETGHEWPFFIGELSVTTQPVNKRQTPTSALRGVQMSEGGTMEGEQVSIDEIRAMRAELAALADMVKGMAGGAQPAPSDVVSEVIEEVAEEVAPMMDPAATEDPAIIAMSERIKRLESEKAQREAEDLVNAAYAQRAIDPKQRPVLMSLAMSDRKAFQTAIALAPVAPRPTQRLAGVAMTEGVRLGSAEHAAQLRSIRESAKSPREAALRMSEYTASLKGVRA